MDQGTPESRPRTLWPHRELQTHSSRCVGSTRHPRPHHTQFSHRAAPPHRAIRPQPTDRRGNHVFPVPNVPTTLRLKGNSTVDAGVHSNERVMSLASRVASRNPTTWLRTGVSLGTGPHFVLKMQKMLHASRGPCGDRVPRGCRSGVARESPGISEIARAIR